MCTYVWVFAHECSLPQGPGEGIRSPRTGGIGVCDVSCGCQKRTQSFKQWNHLISPKVWFHFTLLLFVCLFYIIFGLLHSKNTFKFMSFPSLHFFSCSWYVFKIFYFTLKKNHVYTCVWMWTWAHESSARRSQWEHQMTWTGVLGVGRDLKWVLGTKLWFLHE